MSPIRTALFIALALCAGPAFASEDISKVNGSIEAEAGRTYGELETVNGSIRIAAGAATADAGTVNGGIRLASNVTVNGGIETVNGEIFVDRGGKVKDGVGTVNGAIGLVATQLGGGIETVNGNVTVGVGSHVKGGLRVEKSQGLFNLNSKKRPPRIIIGPNAVVEGPLVFEREVTLYVHRSAKTGPITGATAKPYDGDSAPKD